jgi:hypothetical protein
MCVILIVFKILKHGYMGGVFCFFLLSATSAQQTGKELTLTVYRRFPVNNDYTDSPGGQTLKEAYVSFFSLCPKLPLGKLPWHSSADFFSQSL